MAFPLCFHMTSLALAQCPGIMLVSVYQEAKFWDEIEQTHVSRNAVENGNGHEKVKSVFRLMIKCGWRGMREDRDAEASHPYNCFQFVPMMAYCTKAAIGAEPILV